MQKNYGLVALQRRLNTQSPITSPPHNPVLARLFGLIQRPICAFECVFMGGVFRHHAGDANARGNDNIAH